MNFRHLAALTACFCLLLSSPAARSGDADDSQFENALAARGLIGGAIGDVRASARIPDPAEGAAVTEIVAHLARNGEEAARATMWDEVIAGRKSEFMLTRAPGGQTMLQFWLLREGGGCELYQSVVYSKDGRMVTGDFWRNDPDALRAVGAAEFPSDLFPNFGAPIGAFLDSVGSAKEGATGKLDMEAGPYDFIVLDTWVDGSEKIDSAAGSIDTVKVVMRPDVDSILKSWPSVFRKMALPFIPKDYFYFNSKPPHQLIKFDGSIGYPAPNLKARILRSWIAGAGKTAPPLGTTLDDALAARGLAGGVMADPRARRRIPEPAAGAVVDEIAMTLSSTHEPMAHYRIWHESMGAYALELQITNEARGQTSVNYWVLPARGKGCMLAGVERWSRDGRLVESHVWRNDPATLQIPGAMTFPQDMYPNISIPIDAFFRALEAQDTDAMATVDLQVSPYTYITLNTWKAGTEQVTTAGGSFAVQKVAVRPDLATILPSWPSALRAAVSPLFPKLVLDYDAGAPHDLINFHGPMGWPAPSIDLQLMRRYVAGTPTQSASAQ